MRDFTTIQQAEGFLLSYSPEKQSGQTYTLERMKVLMERLGNPQNTIPAIHVAGTSGKTSTSYFIRALLEASGKKTGLTASPHIASITERVQIGGKPLADKLFIKYLAEFIAILKNWPDLQPTYFELLVAFAFWVFKKEQVEYMVVEVGLGGLLDGTNVITNASKISVITPIGLDHTEVLGTTISAIAKQKVGIVTKDTHVFSAEQTSDASKIIEQTSLAMNSQLHTLHPFQADTSSGMPLFQQANFHLAKQVVEYLAEQDGLVDIPEKTLLHCMTQTPPGRFEVYTIGDKTVVLDGAHNPQKLAAFVESLQNRYLQEPTTWLVGLIEAPEAKINACIQQIKRSTDDYIFTDFTIGQDIKGRRSFEANSLNALAHKMGMDAVCEPDNHAALELLFASKKRTVVVTGSLYLVAQLRAHIIFASKTARPI